MNVKVRCASCKPLALSESVFEAALMCSTQEQQKRAVLADISGMANICRSPCDLHGTKISRRIRVHTSGGAAPGRCCLCWQGGCRGRRQPPGWTVVCPGLLLPGWIASAQFQPTSVEHQGVSLRVAGQLRTRLTAAGMAAATLHASSTAQPQFPPVPLSCGQLVVC